jgi:hypothetical protein
MFSRFKTGRKQADDLKHDPTTVNQNGDVESITPTLLDDPTSRFHHAADSTTREKGVDEHSHHDDVGKYVTSPESDFKEPPDTNDPVLAHEQADSNEKQDAKTAPPTEEDSEGYLTGIPLWLAYLSMLLSIFLVSLDFTIM